MRDYEHRRIDKIILMKQNNLELIERNYKWGLIVSEYEKLFVQALTSKY
ncbi:hypothetical protein SDC9_90994 [bioreactor metagenome]|uniref:Uncharacterized protein n=1 Tax=bioreactor metagenome TaxID=1076179 RepID=A0A644ZUB4_9ZZZZ